jgi:glycosyltransferase involved in cell wall biosynthesis
MSATPLVSIIIPSYNYGHLISDALDSVLKQTYQHWECIIVDDGSIDNTKEIVLSYLAKDTRIRYLFQTNKGLASARNTGIKDSRGVFIQLLDADDLIASTKISAQVDFLVSLSDTDVVFGDVYIFKKDIKNLPQKKKVELMAKPVSGSGKELIDELLVDNIFLVHCAIFRTSLIAEIGYFNESMITCEDWNFWFRIAWVGKKFKYLAGDATEVFVRNHGSNMSSNRKNMWIGKIHFYKEALALMEAHLLEEYSPIRKKARVLQSTYKMRYELAYGSLVSGIKETMTTVLLSGKLFSVLYDSLYWIKERMLNRL